MELKKTIKLNIINKGKNIVCYSLSDLQIVLGSMAVSGNYHIYKVKKDKDKFIIPISIIKERIAHIERRIRKDSARVDLMRQIIK